MLLSPGRARNLSVVGQTRGIECGEVDGARLAVGDKFGHGLTGGRSVVEKPLPQPIVLHAFIRSIV